MTPLVSTDNARPSLSIRSAARGAAAADQSMDRASARSHASARDESFLGTVLDLENEFSSINQRKLRDERDAEIAKLGKMGYFTVIRYL